MAIEEGFEVELSGQAYDVRDIVEFDWDSFDSDDSYSGGWYDSDDLVLTTNDGEVHYVSRSLLSTEEEVLIDMAFDAI